MEVLRAIDGAVILVPTVPPLTADQRAMFDMAEERRWLLRRKLRNSFAATIRAIQRREV